MAARHRLSHPSGPYHNGQAAGVHSVVRRARPVHADRRGQRAGHGRRHRIHRVRTVLRRGRARSAAGRRHCPRRKGQPLLCLRDRPLRRWHAAAGSADRGLGSRRGRLLRRPVRRRSQRRPRLAARRSQRRIPLLVRATRALSDSLRRTGRRSAASRRPQPDAARAPALQGRRPGAPHPDHAHLRRGRQVPGVRRGIRRQEQPDRRRHRTSRGNRARRQSHRPSLPPDQLRHCACTKNTGSHQKTPCLHHRSPS